MGTLLEDLDQAAWLLEGRGRIRTTGSGLDLAARLREHASRLRAEMERVAVLAARDIVSAEKLGGLIRINGGPLGSPTPDTGRPSK